MKSKPFLLLLILAMSIPISLDAKRYEQSIFSKAVNSPKQIYFEILYYGLTLVSNAITISTPTPELESCLYFGEILSEKFEKLMWQFPFKDSERDRIWKGLNIIPEWNHYNGPMYAHFFMKRIRLLFPRSNFQSEVDYLLIPSVNGSDRDEFRWKDELSRYISNHPNGVYLLKAKLDLAHFHDNYWDVLSNNKGEYYSFFSCGDVKKDIEMAEKHRSIAIGLYKEIISKATIFSAGFSPEEIEETKLRLKDLRRRIHWYKTWIIND